MRVDGNTPVGPTPAKIPLDPQDKQYLQTLLDDVESAHKQKDLPINQIAKIDNLDCQIQSFYADHKISDEQIMPMNSLIFDMKNQLKKADPNESDFNSDIQNLRKMIDQL